MLRYYNDLLEPTEIIDYKNKLLKTVYSLIASLCMMPYVGYQLFTLNRDFIGKRPRLLAGLAFQFAFSMLNIRWSRDFTRYEGTMQKKYLEHLPEE